MNATAAVRPMNMAPRAMSIGLHAHAIGLGRKIFFREIMVGGRV